MTLDYVISKCCLHFQRVKDTTKSKTVANQVARKQKHPNVQSLTDNDP